MLDLNILLQAENLVPHKVLVLRHRPTEPRLRKLFGWLAEEQPSLFNLYQRSHGPKTEAALRRASHVASFIGHEAGRAVFVGLFSNDGAESITRVECNRHPDYRRLMELGMSPWSEDDPRQTALLFDLRLLDNMAQWKGRLVVDWPKPELVWARWADRNNFAVRAIHEDTLLAADMPPWSEISLNWNELRTLPTKWRSALSQWRGIYFIFDVNDGKGYVGSAYGTENILGRWLNYSGSGHGGNRHLRARDPSNFVFSILQRVSPDMPPDEIVGLESNWKVRLHTAVPHGLNGN